MLRRVMNMQSGGESCYSRLTNTTGARRCAGTVRVSTTQRCRGQRECGRREGVVSEKWRRCFIERGDTRSTAYMPVERINDVVAQPWFYVRAM